MAINHVNFYTGTNVTTKVSKIKDGGIVLSRDNSQSSNTIRVYIKKPFAESNDLVEVGTTPTFIKTGSVECSNLTSPTINIGNDSSSLYINSSAGSITTRVLTVTDTLVLPPDSSIGFTEIKTDKITVPATGNAKFKVESGNTFIDNLWSNKTRTAQLYAGAAASSENPALRVSGTAVTITNLTTSGTFTANSLTVSNNLVARGGIEVSTITPGTSGLTVNGYINARRLYLSSSAYFEAPGGGSTTKIHGQVDMGTLNAGTISARGITASYQMTTPVITTSKITVPASSTGYNFNFTVATRNGHTVLKLDGPLWVSGNVYADNIPT